jgi:hypothetical protein
MHFSAIFGLFCIPAIFALNTTTSDIGASSIPVFPSRNGIARCTYPPRIPTKCEQVLTGICPPENPACRELWLDSADKELRPKISSCLDLVKDGKLGVEDAVKTMETWGVTDETERKEDEGEGNDQLGDMGMIMSLLNGLGLQAPPKDNDIGEKLENLGGLEGVLGMLGGAGKVDGDDNGAENPDLSSIMSILNNPQILEAIKSIQNGEGTENFDKALNEMQLENVLDNPSRTDELVINPDPQNDTSEAPTSSEIPAAVNETPEPRTGRTLNWLFYHDPAAAHARLAPLLQAASAAVVGPSVKPHQKHDRNETQTANATRLDSVDAENAETEDEGDMVDGTDVADEHAADTPENAL